MATFSQIQERVNRRVIDLPPAVVAEVPLLVNEAIKEAQRRHNFRIMEAELEATTVAGQRLLAALPADWKEKRAKGYVRLGQDGAVGTLPVYWLASKEEAIRRYPLDDPFSTGTPRRLLEVDGELLVFPFPDTLSQWNDGNYRVVVPYWKYLPELVNPADTNWFTDNAEQYVFMWATGEAFAVNWDLERSLYWKTRAEKQFRLAQQADKRSRIERGMTLQVHRDVNWRR